MAKRVGAVVVFIFMCMGAFAQDAVEKRSGESGSKISTNISAQAQYSNTFVVDKFYFNKRIDVEGRGDILEAEFVINNLADDPMDLYIFVIATYEKVEKTKSSFEMPIPEKERIMSFVPSTGEIGNFEYENPAKKGEKMLVKFPKNPQAGVNPETGKPYVLKDSLVVRTYHLSKYSRKQVYFNNVTLLIFDAGGKAVYRRIYQIEGKRR